MAFLFAEICITMYYKDEIEGRERMVISLRMTEEEKRLAESYAKIHGISVSEAIKRAFFEKVEDEFDIAEADLALREFEKDPKTYTLDEVKKMFDL